MKRLRVACLVGVALIVSVLAVNVSAEVSPDSPESPAGWAVLEKLGRGLGNAVGGWLEIPLNIQIQSREKDPLTGIFTGVLIGVFKGVARTAVGVYETATFFIPYPEGYQPVLPPLFQEAELLADNQFLF